MYALALYRLNALDQRTPILSGVLTGLLACIGTLAPTHQVAALMFYPLTLLWLLRTTIGHARSFEDCLRRIEELEIALNARFGQRLIDFQSSHPSRLVVVGGRTGEESVLSVLVVSVLLLGTCLYVFTTTNEAGAIGLYMAYLAMTFTSLVLAFRRYISYGYRKSCDLDSKE